MNHSTSQRDMHTSTFGTPGMSTSTSGSTSSQWNHSTSGNAYGSLSDSLNQSLSQARPQYQAGYLMSASTSNNLSQSGQRYDDAPIIPTKAKMNNALARSTTSDFGTDSMFEKSRTSRPDEDAPPVTSVTEMMNDIPPDSSQSRFQPRNAFASPLHRPLISSRSYSAPSHQSALLPQTPKPQGPDSQPLYVVVFGYPPDKYTATLEYFKSFGGESETTEATLHSQITNCFKLGFNNPGDALRAVRKNGEIIGGTWMIGVKWADPQLAESALGSSLTRSGIFDFRSPSPSDLQLDTTVPMSLDDGFPTSINSPSPGGFSNAPAFGTPIKLAPSGAAFRRAGVPSVRNTPIDPVKSQLQGPPPPANKGVFGQVSEMIFGW